MKACESGRANEGRNRAGGGAWRRLAAAIAGALVLTNAFQAAATAPRAAIATENQAGDNERAPLSLDVIKQKLEPVLRYLDLDGLACLDESSVVRYEKDKRRSRVVVTNRSAGVEFRVDDSPVGLTRFSTLGSKPPEGLGRDAAIGRDAVLTRMNAFLERLGVDMEITADDIRLTEIARESGSPMGEIWWEAWRHYKHEGVKFFRCRVSVTASPYTGRIISFSWHPPTAVPDTMGKSGTDYELS